MSTEERMPCLLHGFRYLNFAFRDVVATVQRKDGSRMTIAIPGVVYSEYESGPNLFHLADWVAYTHRNLEVAFVGLASATPLGRQLQAVA